MMTQTLRNSRKIERYIYFTLFICICTISGCNRESSSKQQETVAASRAKAVEVLLPEIPDSIKTPNGRADYLVIHFWDNYNFRDTLSLRKRPDIVEKAFTDYVNILLHTTDDVSSRSVKNVLRKAEVDKVVFDYFKNIFRRYLYEQESLLRDEKHYVPVLEYIVESGRTTESEKSNARAELKILSHNQKGSVAANFVYYTSSTQTGTLHQLKTENLLLLIYDTESELNDELIKQVGMSSIIGDEMESGRLKVLAFYPKSDENRWRKFQPNIPSSWINGYDPKNEVRIKGLFDMTLIPTLYLLDAEKRVILKDVSFQDLEVYLVEHRPMMLENTKQ